ncbi:helix-turn-helix domain-containing protein [Microcoleus sp. herbarium12]|uniref:helix-turn-helix domain-containing protein n=1 Tax=Microcoleus sp. herbarium12 TaxID=3055437 RepID=UPI002FD07F47
MALKPEAYFGVTDHATIEVSQESFRSVLGQIEAELLCSDTYTQALASLQTMLGSAASAAEILIRAVSREAVKLAFDRFGKPNKTEIQVAQDNFAAASDAASYIREVEPSVPAPVFYWRSATLEAPSTTEPETENCGDTYTSEESKQAPQAEIQVESAAPALTVIAPAKSFPGFGFPQKQKKITKEEAAAIATQQREECLQELGRELRKGRQIRSLSLQQLHSQTLVPLHHIEAIENGEIEKLPQDIYVRGFIRRLGDALGLDGTAMANALPKPAPNPIIPSTYLSASDSDSGEGFQMHPVHLYIGYTALMAGAIGGVGWLSQQPVVPGANAVQPQVTPPASVAPSPKSQEKAPQPGLKKSHNGAMIVGADMAPPEVIFG